MKTSTVQTNDPCLPIQMDLSAMLDGELDPAVVRRVMVHSDVCASCSAFLAGIRTQARAHRELAACQMLDDGAAATVGLEDGVLDAAAGGASVQCKELRQRLLDNQRQLAKVLYELGRGFVLMGVDPSFSRVVSREPVPVPDMCLRGRNLLDEMERMSSAERVGIGHEWVRAKVLFNEREIRSPEQNLAKGRRLLREALQLCEDYHEARIYLGHAYQVDQDHGRAAAEFEKVLATAEDPVTRAFALENLGNLHLEQGRLRSAIQLFRELIDSGVIATEPRFYTTYFNLALACGFSHDFLECERWLGTLDKDFPHKRRALGAEFGKRIQFRHLLSRNPEALARLAARFPTWFSLDDGKA